MDIAEMVWATGIARRNVDSSLKRAEEVKGDTRKKERLEKHECKACFYYPRVGGAAMTWRNCAGCDTEQVYNSTSTDALCIDCAKTNKLCKHCGGDIDMKTRRRKWPEF